MPKYTSSREYRNKFPTNPPPTMMSCPSNFAKMEATCIITSTHESNISQQTCNWQDPKGLITVRPDGSIVIDPKAYADDVVAFVLGCIHNNPTISNELKDHLRRFVDGMDQRAMNRHGYSNNQVERDYTWVSLTNSSVPTYSDSAPLVMK